jgi:phosphoribosylaminoimidazole-succinocarboxamide synthase
MTADHHVSRAVTRSGHVLTDLDLALPDRREGKVRISWALPGDRRLFVTTDRLSAFDRVVGAVAHKGQVLNQIAAHWFDVTRDVVANHALAVPDPNVLVARAARPLPVEVIVRGHITGITSTSLWTRYAAGARTIDGHRLPDGLRKHDALAEPIVTPTTKAEGGAHDEPLSCAEVVERGLVEPVLWDRVLQAALELFRRGRTVAAEAGLILADTKYEFGLTADGELLLIDEVHTPDSSRLWRADTYEARRRADEDPDGLDKEATRIALVAAPVGADGERLVDASLWDETSARYVEAYERLVGQPFLPAATPIEPRITHALARAGVL